MATQLENNTSTIETLIDVINALPDAMIIDTSLTQSGQAADAKAVGDAINNHIQSASTITAGTFAGTVVAQASSQTPSTSMLRNTKIVSTATNPSNNGEIYWTYT